MVGQWIVKFNMLNKKVSKSIQALTMVDKATNWPEVAAVKTKSSFEVSQVFDQEWLCRYPRPYRCIHDNGGEFLGVEFQELLSSYGILSQATAVKKPRGKSVVERMHLTIADILRTMEFDGLNWQRELHSCLQAAVWAIRATVSTMSNYFLRNLCFQKI